MSSNKLYPESTPTPVARKEPKLMVKKSLWREICEKTLERANFRCEICDRSLDDGVIEPHEVWEYDDEDKVATFVNMIALCAKCHLCKHIGTAKNYAKVSILVEHLSDVNGIDAAEAELLFNKSLRIFRMRNQHPWTVVLSHLKEYGLDVSKYQQTQS